MAVDMKAVESSNISHVGYDADKRELHVTFKANGKTYVHANVEPDQHIDMMDAATAGASIGSHYAKHFRGNDRHPHRPLEGDAKPS